VTCIGGWGSCEAENKGARGSDSQEANGPTMRMDEWHYKGHSGGASA
jgi:hypothetical protein